MADAPVFSVPNGWEVDDEQEGGQPNGIGVIEPSNARAWFTDERETHHRRVITMYGPWEEGTSHQALIGAEAARKRRAADDAQREERTIREAQEIIARRAARGDEG